MAKSSLYIIKFSGETVVWAQSEEHAKEVARSRADKMSDQEITMTTEPMVNMKSPQIKMAPDGWTALAVDGLPSAHFEHTVLVDEDEAEIITVPDGYDCAKKFFAEELPA